MPVTLGFKGDGVRPFVQRLERFRDRVMDARPAFNAMADHFRRAQIQQFASRGGHYGPLWKPLSPRYAAQKARRYPGQPLMVREGHLRDDVTNRPFGVEHISSQRMIVGTPLAHARYHQGGMGNNPVRKIIGTPTKADKKAYAGILHQYIVEGAVSNV